ncbi:MerR family transcriptional regulator [Roseovarius sp. EL26]|uniref:MerR family transcriptional regulator n=1 Tax=Roseovarius sp. EL26 TaxID=2126672 RepID=UPI0013C46720|nr:MerR family transcriptional regulator [Roseovarius sp. EL26]
MAKSADAFRTISEVADWLETPAHVLRFWESKFSQIKPVKRAGGRRYYRPNDMRLIGGIKKLLHDDGMTIKGVQKILRADGIKHVASLSQSLDDGGAGPAPSIIDATVASTPQNPAQKPEPLPVGTTQPVTDIPVDATPSPTPREEPSEARETAATAKIVQQADAEPSVSPETAVKDTTPTTVIDADPSPAEAPMVRPEQISIQQDPADDCMAGSGVLTALSRFDRPLTAAQITALAPIAERLQALASRPGSKASN